MDCMKVGWFTKVEMENNHDLGKIQKLASERKME